MDIDKIAQEFKDSQEAKRQLNREKEREKKQKEKKQSREQELKRQGTLKNTDVVAAASAHLQETTLFMPTPEQKKVKARFWIAYRDNPIMELDQLSLQDVTILCQDARVQKWWNIPGFASWFRNHLESREKLEYLFDLSLDVLQEILLDPEPKTAGAKVNAVKLIGELASKFPKQTAKPVVLDQEIGQLSEDELRKLVGGSEVRRVIEITDRKQEDEEA